MSHRVLLTGASGFVGSHLRSAVARSLPEVELVRLTGRRETVEADDKAVDLLDAEAVDALVRDVCPDTVVHLAAQSSVAQGHADAGRTWASNLSATVNLAIALGRHVPRATVLFASTAEVYGASFLGGTVSEATAPTPLNVYAKSKLMAERALAEILPASARLITVRPSNHSGAGQREQFVLPSFAAQIARIEAGEQEPVLSVGNLDVRRDFLDVRDVVEAYVGLLAQAPRLPHRLTVNVSSGSSPLLRDLVDDLRGLSTATFDVAVDRARMRPADIPAASIDSSLLRTTIGWAPRRPLRETLAALLDHARSRTTVGADRR